MEREVVELSRTSSRSVKQSFANEKPCTSYQSYCKEMKTDISAPAFTENMKLLNHKLKCRLCLASFDEYEHQKIKITEKIQESIAALMRIEVS